MKPKRELSELFDQLSAQDQQSVLQFARFLRAQSSPHADPSPKSSTPQLIPAVHGESVIGAIKRLNASYPMLEKGKLLDQTTVLVAQHTLQGRPKEEVIADLEQLFVLRYQQYISEKK